MKIGILGTVTPEGLPHLTMISTLKASSPTQMAFGQFMEGRSKEYLRQNPRAGWLIMSLDKQVWRGKADFTHTAKQGAEYDFYNNTPLFRYNAYVGVHTGYYLNVVQQSGDSPLPMQKVVPLSGPVTHFQVLRFLNAQPDRHKIATILGEQGGLPFGLPNP